ncbi:hypothetical protein BDP27DRAFT_1420532 [Rhodocollybia butyracea]|uniref:Uncharacterized protein n=1 Tax=Rhodocollybia butyracea TaxID=206335 RepID=A0A9P5U7F3_9AGAR|nr:hypothetical protein BDP27DRAFT_1420532 [Rhodocollybia butyracea]
MASANSTSASNFSSQDDLLDTVQWALIGISVASTLYGACVIISSVSAYFLIHEKPTVNTSRKLLLAIIAVMLLCDTTFIFTFVGYLIAFFRDHNNEALALAITTSFAVRVNYLLSDVVVVWRAWTLAAVRYPRAKYILVLCLGASCVAVITSSVMITISEFQPEDSPLNTSFALEIYLPLVLLITNVVATSFIGIITWESRHSMNLTYKGSNSKRFRTTGRLLVLMLESGFIYSFFWLLVLVNAALSSLFAEVMLMAIVPQITTVYPTIVIFLNATHRSVYTETDENTTYTPIKEEQGLLR